MKRKGKPLSLGVFARRKAAGEKIVVLTAYDLTSALIATAGGVDAILVGDSVGMVVLGHETTLPVTVDDMVHHCAAVSRARPGVPIIADMPYGSFHVSPEETVHNALRLVKTAGASAVKIEGGSKRAAVIQALLEAEIPVMGHLGLTPQSINRFGGYKIQGRGEAAANELLAEAKFLAEAGCFAMVLECMPSVLAERITREIPIPTIGIGAGAGCSGQVLVFHDMLGLFTGIKPRFVKRYAELGEQAVAAVDHYAQDVRQGRFPGPEHGYEDNAVKKPRGEAEDTAAAAGSGQQTGYLSGLDEKKD